MRDSPKYIELEDLVDCIVDNRGKTVPTVSEGIPLIATNCIKHSSIYPTFENIRYINQETYHNWFRAHLEPYDILFVNKGTPGRSCIVPNPINFVAAQDMVGLRFRKEFNPFYMLAVLRSTEIQNTIKNNYVGLVIPHFRKQELVKLKLPILEKNTRDNIGHLYYLLSQKIELNNQINAELEAMAKTLYDYWFVQFDFPNNDGKPYRSSGGKMVYNELLKREIPEGWEVKKLEEYVNCYDSIRIPLSSSQRKLRTGKIPYYGATSIMDFVDEYIFNGEYVLLAEDGSVINENGNPILQHIKGKSWVNNHAHVLEPRDKKSYDFLKLTLSKISAPEIMSGSVQKKITQGNLLGKRFFWPTTELLYVFNNILIPIRNKVFINEKQNQELAQLRDWLLPMLMNGQVTVGDVEERMGMVAEEKAGYKKFTI